MNKMCSKPDFGGEEQVLEARAAYAQDSRDRVLAATFSEPGCPSQISNCKPPGFRPGPFALQARRVPGMAQDASLHCQLMGCTGATGMATHLIFRPP